ncbi:uncharacterized protein TM35_000391240 [Trypanosoma theileri]|uniref:Uncharacterized protein n=1 Tax=Trypanosoma theileri TaxID=67003 RepID=A0A1X0NLH0_9TRYP|nr:uncharacterized protein TM35_000391240 [Trypanosoma theileri]ORC84950.1 hypothetical protein TM35_000391240 [Trypanosoma theileri]
MRLRHPHPAQIPIDIVILERGNFHGRRSKHQNSNTALATPTRVLGSYSGPPLCFYRGGAPAFQGAQRDLEACWQPFRAASTVPHGFFPQGGSQPARRLKRTCFL